MIYIFWTCSSEIEAEKIVQFLIESKWIACANILPPMKSLFWWDGQLQKEVEVKVILKTKKEMFQKISEYIQACCSYEVAEISMVVIDQGNPSYLKWLQDIIK